MKFGKLPNISKVDFSLPPDPIGTINLLEKLAKTNVLPHIYVGCTGWSMKEWIGRIYPKGTKAKDYLKHYSKQFNTIEFNTTHYRIPSPDIVAKWYAESTPDFRFCPKIPQTISHRNDLGLNDNSIAFFTDAISGLKEKLGCCFMQLPPYFGADRLPMLERFFQAWPANISLAIELRHESWFQQNSHFEALNHLLEKHNISTVITDVAGRRDVLHNRLTTNTLMLRFVGNASENELHPTDYERIDEWTAKIADWTKKGLNELYLFAHEPDNLLAPELAKYWVEALDKKVPAILRGPTFMEDKIEGQMSLF